MTMSTFAIAAAFAADLVDARDPAKQDQAYDDLVNEILRNTDDGRAFLTPTGVKVIPETDAVARWRNWIPRERRAASDRVKARKVAAGRAELRAAKGAVVRVELEQALVELGGERRWYHIEDPRAARNQNPDDAWRWALVADAERLVA